MEFIYLVNKNDWKLQGNTWIAYVPFNCSDNDTLLINIIDNDELIKEHENFYNSLSGGVVLNNYCSVVSTVEPECDVLLKVAKSDINNTIENNDQQFDLSALQGMFGGAQEVIHVDDVLDNEVKDESLENVDEV